MCLDLDNSTKGKTNKYFILIKKELENKVYTYDEFKTIVKDIITKFNQNDEYIDKSSSSMNFYDEKLN